MTYIFDMTTGLMLEQYEIDRQPDVTLIEAPVEISTPQPRLETVHLGYEQPADYAAPCFIAGPLDDLIN